MHFGLVLDGLWSQAVSLPAPPGIADHADQKQSRSSERVSVVGARGVCGCQMCSNLGLAMSVSWRVECAAEDNILTFVCWCEWLVAI